MGMPFGMQITGRFRGDIALLNAAEALEAAWSRLPGLARPRPDLARLTTPRPELRGFATRPSTHPHAVAFAPRTTDRNSP